jgi:hypothetical protein
MSISKNQIITKNRTKFQINFGLGIKTITKIKKNKNTYCLEWGWLISNKFLIKLKKKMGKNGALKNCVMFQLNS